MDYSRKYTQFLPYFFMAASLAMLFTLLYLYRSSLVLSLKIHDIFTVFLSVIIEASPFLLLGSLIAVIIKKTSFVQKVLHHIPKNPLLGLPISAALGTVLPVCECGNMPIARSLVERGFPAAYATAFLFSAPILNPAVFFSTWVAFRGQPVFIAARFIMGFIVAVAAGAYVLWQERRGVSIWKPMLDTTKNSSSCESHGHHHAADHDHQGSFTAQVFSEFFAIFPYLVFGAIFTALFQAYIPREAFFGSDTGIALAIVLMMLFAFIISVCSNTDAFLALGFTGIVPPAAILSFLVFGPMIDAKNVLIYSRIFTIRGLMLVSFFIAQLVFLLALAVHKLNIV